MSPYNRYIDNYDNYDDEFEFADDYVEDYDDSADDENEDAIEQFLERRSRSRRNYPQGGYSPDLNERLEYYARATQREGYSEHRRYADYDDEAYRQARSARRLLADGRTLEPPRRAPYSRNFAPPHTDDLPSDAKRGGNLSLGKLLRSLIVLALCLIAAYYGLMMTLTGGINRVKVDTLSVITPAESVADIKVVSSTASVKNVLLIGIDDDGSSGSRSDTIMIASIDTNSNTIRLCSILRDNYVTIPGHGKSRINSAYAYGGAELLIQTIEKNFRIDIDDYVSIDMDAMISVVDAIGGVTIKISEKEAYQINRYSYSKSPDVSAGEQRLDGRQAVEYARIRKIDSDFGRTNRQRTLINAIVAECRSLSPFKLMSLVNTVSPYLTTNMSSAKIASLALMVVPAMGNEMEQLSIPVEGTYKSETKMDMAVLVPDLPANAAALREFLYGAEE